MIRIANIAACVAAVSLMSGCGGEPDGADAEVAAAATAEAPSGTSPLEAADTGITARTHFGETIAAARGWQADAQLFGVHTSFAESGYNAFWFYDVQSPATGQCTRFRVLGAGQIERVEEPFDCVLSAPAPERFIDSPEALAAALAAGFRHDDDITLHLQVMRDDEALPEPRACWVVYSTAYDADPEQGVARRGWCVDPGTGGFVTRLSGYGRPARLQEDTAVEDTAEDG